MTVDGDVPCVLPAEPVPALREVVAAEVVASSPSSSSSLGLAVGIIDKEGRQEKGGGEEPTEFDLGLHDWRLLLRSSHGTKMLTFLAAMSGRE